MPTTFRHPLGVGHYEITVTCGNCEREMVVMDECDPDNVLCECCGTDTHDLKAHAAEAIVSIVCTRCGIITDRYDRER